MAADKKKIAHHVQRKVHKTQTEPLDATEIPLLAAFQQGIETDTGESIEPVATPPKVIHYLQNKAESAAKLHTQLWSSAKNGSFEIEPFFIEFLNVAAWVSKNSRLMGPDSIEYLMLIAGFYDKIFRDTMKVANEGSVRKNLTDKQISGKIHKLGTAYGEAANRIQLDAVLEILERAVSLEARLEELSKNYENDKVGRPTAPQFLNDDTLEKAEKVRPIFTVEATPELIAERLRRAREAKGWSQLQLANAMGLKSNRTVQNLEQGNERLSIAQVQKAMEALEINEL